MRLRNVLKDVSVYGQYANIHINNIRTNSKEVHVGDLFIAIKGLTNDGHEYIDEAIKNGATVIIYQGDISKREGIIYLRCDNTKVAKALIGKNFYHDITKRVKLIGITGTNGKTTVSTLLYHFFEYSSIPSLLIGTEGISYDNCSYETGNTTPDILVTLNVIYEAYKKGCRIVIMEVSSQAIDMLRVYGFSFDVAVFTNLTHEHLDYHKTMEKYQNAKGQFISSINRGKKSFVVLNRDSPVFDYYYQISRARVVTYGIKNQADYGAININKTLDKGTSFKLIYDFSKESIQTYLLGEFNIYNILGAISVIHQMGYKISDFKTFLKIYVSNNGRMEMLKLSGRTFIIDYAHTPDGVKSVMDNIKEYSSNNLIVVVGCGGNRDKSKRPLIGNIVTSMANHVIFTNDNPRMEPEIDIISDILAGVQNDNYEVIINRREAIKKAIDISHENDIIAVLGKGNEASQIINNIKYPFNDKDIIRKIIGKEEA